MCARVCVDGKGRKRQVRSFAEEKCEDLILWLGFSGSWNLRKPSNMAAKHWFSFIVIKLSRDETILKTELNHESYSDVQLLVFCQEEVPTNVCIMFLAALTTNNAVWWSLVAGNRLAIWSLIIEGDMWDCCQPAAACYLKQKHGSRHTTDAWHMLMNLSH